MDPSEGQVINLELNKDGQFVNAQTGEAPGVLSTGTDFTEYMPQWLVDQHYGGVAATPPGSPIPMP
jgi:hypothetical protein